MAGCFALLKLFYGRRMRAIHILWWCYHASVISLRRVPLFSLYCSTQGIQPFFFVPLIHIINCIRVSSEQVSCFYIFRFFPTFCNVYSTIIVSEFGYHAVRELNAVLSCSLLVCCVFYGLLLLLYVVVTTHSANTKHKLLVPMLHTSISSKQLIITALGLLHKVLA